MPYNIDDLLHLMACLRDPHNGCPWDLQQTAQTIINYSIEEVYELAHSIEHGLATEQQNELGDVLFQVIFLSQIAQEQGSYQFADVVNSLCEKLLRRHPHVFSDGKLYAQPEAQNKKPISQTEVQQNWEQIKQIERQQKKQNALFDDLPENLPALKRAAKIQKRASTIGLDWPNTLAAFEKLKEEISELEQEIDSGDTQQTIAQEEELGDVLFSCVNVARKLGIDAEQALRKANHKFIGRAQSVDDAIAENSEQDATPAIIDTYWNAAKDREKS